MPNTLLKIEEMTKRVLEMVREACNGDERLMQALMVSLSVDLMDIDMQGNRITESERNS